MLERIKQQVMTRYYNKQKELEEQMQGQICPKIRKKVLKNAEASNYCYALPAGQGVFQVQSREMQYIVDLTAKQCECRRWQLTGIPCNHAISCLRHERVPPESVLPDCYTTSAFKKAYGFNVWPCTDKSSWEKVNGPEIKPPIYEKKVGKPKNLEERLHMRFRENMAPSCQDMVLLSIACIAKLPIITVVDVHLRSKESALKRPKKLLQQQHNNKLRSIQMSLSISPHRLHFVLSINLNFVPTMP